MNNNKSSAKKRNLFQFNSVEIFTWFTSHFNRVRAGRSLYVFKLLHTTKQPTNLIASRSRHCWTLHAIAKILIHVLHMCMRWEKTLSDYFTFLSTQTDEPFFLSSLLRRRPELTVTDHWSNQKSSCFDPIHSSQPFSHTRRTSRSRSISSEEMVKAPLIVTFSHRLHKVSFANSYRTRPYEV